ncbi:SusC/RagA family TonB-linked outer membrane protein [Sphingobacterium sp. UBA5670]|uniref:SusC/RagA family TonB-linked outer membrane protein n=1 Tax=Sphingobacterium sp. UBA5670 TaxID=1947502 RepID=UPI0025F4FC0A|nr:SusC/RagA family TonB-linked outer membrane protein [Sphingobacterium sp. UBA5670]
MNGLFHSMGGRFFNLQQSKQKVPSYAQSFRVLTLCISLFAASTTVKAQDINLTVKNEPLEQVIKKLRERTDYIIMAPSSIMSKTKPVTINLKRVTIDHAMREIFKNQPEDLDYEIKGKNIIIRQRGYIKDKKVKSNEAQKPITGKIQDKNGQAISGASVHLPDGSIVITDYAGFFSIAELTSDEVFITMLGFVVQKVILKNDRENIIVLKPSQSILDEAVVMGYGVTSKRFNTGSIERIGAEEISTQPVSNPLAALAGRIPGMTITPTNGNPGSGFKVQIQGQNAMAIGANKNTVNSEPLYIIDGVPYAPNNSAVNQGTSAISNNGAGLSPFNFLNPSDIQSIEVLKDADATAIYGSKGAYGVILITTKKGTVGKTQVNLSISSGFSKVPKMLTFLNTDQYLEMRKEAFANDNVTADENNAPDLLLWDQHKYTNFQKEFIGGTARYNDIQVSATGGNATTQFLISGGQQNQGTVYPGSKGDKKSSGHFNLNHKSEDDRFQLSLTTSYVLDKNNNISSDLTNLGVIIPPNYPDLFDSNGNLLWEYKGVPLYYDNPYAYLKTSYTAKSSNLNSSLNLSYRVLPEVKLMLNGGYNAIQINETSLYPITSMNPLYNPTGYSTLGNNALKSWILEPQAEYKLAAKSSQFTILLGSTFQKNWSEGSFISAYGYPSDDLLGSIAAATSSTLTNNNSDYRYSGVFTRLNYSYKNKFIANLSGRRDGSSRFGPGNRFGNFGAIGLAYIFTEEHWAKSNLKFLSFGKLRSSYGITGSDQIGNYQFMDTWKVSTNPYGSISGLYPTRLANPNFKWEKNNKFSAALELGFLKDRLIFTTNYYNNISGNHLLSSTIPYTTGFTSILENFPAKVKNYGWEFLINSNNIKNSSFSWSTTANLTIPHNKLLSFPDFEHSAYFNTYVIGEPLNIIRGYAVSGVNPQTGVFELMDVPTGQTTGTNDLINLGTTDPKFYGGLGNTFNYKGIGLNLFFEFKKQTGKSLLYDIYTSSSWPGMMQNFPTEILSRWQKPGDITDYQKYSANYGTDAAVASELMSRPNKFTYTDASYIRLKNVEVSYNLPQNLLQAIRLNRLMVFARAQNLLTISGYKGLDPETQSSMTLPTLRTITFGLSASF